jgi:EmrB/QacA subfamily drug resistance transporter
VNTSTQRWTLGLTAAAAFMVALDQLVVATALDRIRLDLHASISTLDWTVNAFSLSFAVLLITGAALGDRFGRRRLFAIGTAIFTLASAACALAPNAGTLIAARAVQGSGAALVAPLAVALLTAAFPPQRRGPIVGIFTAFTGLAVAGGPVVGGAVAQGIAWQWIFWLNVPVGVLLIPLATSKIAESRGPQGRFDLVGLGLICGGILGLVWGLVRADAAGWSSGEVIGTLVGGGVLCAAFVAWELRVVEPMLPMHLFRIRSYSAANAAMLLLSTSLFGSVFLFAQYLQVSLGYDPLAAGLRFLPWTGALFFVAPLSGALIGRIGGRPLLATGLALQAVGLAWVAYDIGQASSYAAMVPALIIAGCGTSMALPAGQNTVMNSAPPAFLGKASGTFNAVRQLGGVLGIAVVSAVFAARGSYASPQAFRDGAGPALGVAAAIALLATLAALLITGVRRPAPAPQALGTEPIPAGVDAPVG